MAEMEIELRGMRRKVLLDSVLTRRAEIVVYRNEIQRFLIQAAVKTLDSETIAITNCLKLQGREIEAYIHPFQ